MFWLEIPSGFLFYGKTQKRMEVVFDEELSIMAEQELCMERLYAYNHTRPSEHAKREQLLKEMLAECGAALILFSRLPW